MNAGSSPGFPGSRTLAGWSRQLAAWRPQSVWVAHLIIHRVEALVRISRHRRLDRVETLLLQLLDRPNSRVPLPDVPGFLAGVMDPANEPTVVRHMLSTLERAGLVGPAGQGWSVTPLGKTAAEHGTYPKAEYERRVFSFLSAGGREQPLALALPATIGTPWPAADPVSFDVDGLHACVRESAEWKAAHGFPADVEEILTWPHEPYLNGGATPAWQRVVLDRVQSFTTAVIRPGEREESGLEAGVAESTPCLLAFRVEPENWSLNSAQPVLALTPDQAARLPELTADPSMEAWRGAWSDWCRPRNLPVDETDACELRRSGVQLQVLAPPEFMERLRASRSDALKGEAWVVAGEGRVRAAAQLHVTEATEPSGR